MEPELCGCGENYLNFGCFYEADAMAEKRPALLALRQANQAIYPAVYAHLRSARALEACVRESAENRDPEGLYRLTRSLFELPQARDAAGDRRDVFLRAWTPAGLTDHSGQVRALYPTCVALRDPCGLSAPLFERLERHFRTLGYDCVRTLSPVDPGRPEGLLVPERGLALLATATEPADCAVTVDLSRFFHMPKTAAALLARAHEHCLEASAALAEAKAIHDEMEALCRPFVCFDGVDLLTEEYRKQLRADLLRQ